MSVKKIMRTVNVKGESIVKGGKCTTEKIRPRPHTVTIPPSKTCTTGTTSKPLWVSVIEDGAQARVFHKRTVDKKVIGGVTEGASAIGTVAGQMGKAATVGTIIPDTAVLWVTGSSLMAAGTLVFGTVNAEMARGVALKTTSRFSRNGFWAQAGMVRCNLCRVGGRASLMKSRSIVSRDVKRNVKQHSGGRLWRWDGVFQAQGWGGRMQRRDR